MYFILNDYCIVKPFFPPPPYQGKKKPPSLPLDMKVEVMCGHWIDV